MVTYDKDDPLLLSEVICGVEMTFSCRPWEYGDILVRYRDRTRDQGRIFGGPPDDDGRDGRHRAMGRLTGW